MLKQSASFVLGIDQKSSTYPRGVRLAAFDLPAALLEELFEHPAGVFPVVIRQTTSNVIVFRLTGSNDESIGSRNGNVVAECGDP